MAEKILMVSGEPSGDLHGSFLIEALKGLVPSIEVKGMGGPRMRRAGLKGIDSTGVSVVGISEVLKKFPSILGAFRALKGMLKSERFDCVVLIDYPDFNLHFGRAAKKQGAPVVYYISPQVWAWRRGRIKKIARVVRKMLVVFPFEEKLYRNSGVDALYVGHPLVENAVSGLTKDEAKKTLGFDRGRPLVGVFPGSRSEEVRRILPSMLEAVKILERKLEREVDIVIPLAEGLGNGIVEGFVEKAGLKAKAVRNKIYEVLRGCDAAAVASGTATLEAALIGAPMVVVYRVSPISYAVGRALIGIRHVALPNIVAGEEIVTELLQHRANPENIAEELYLLFTDEGKLKKMQSGYERIKKALSPPGPESAPLAAARAIMETIGAKPVNR